MTQPKCTHLLVVESAEEPETHGRRIVHMVCPTCGYKVDKLTTMTDEELAAAQVESQAQQ